MRRREFIAGLGGAAALPLAARAQQAMPLMGFFFGGSAERLRSQITAFHDGLKEAGYVAGQNVTVDQRSAEGHFDRIPAIVSDMVRQPLAVLATSTIAAALTAKRATSTIPIVFSVGEDPVKSGLVASLNRPEGNMTGVYQFTAGLEAKRLGILREAIPNAETIAVLVNPNFSGSKVQLSDVQEAATRLGARIIIVRANTEQELNSAFADLAQQRAGAVQVCASPYFNARREHIVVLAARHGVPAIYEWRDFAAAGGLMSYGTSLSDAYRQAGVYAGRILKGAKPADLPVIQVTRFEFVINLSTVRTLGLTIPPTLLARADEVIE